MIGKTLRFPNAITSFGQKKRLWQSYPIATGALFIVFYKLSTFL
jgi:hypothetical protein